MVRFVQQRAPEELRAPLQAVAHSAVGCGTVAGYLLGGRLLSAQGGHALDGMAAGAATLALLLYAALVRSGRAESKRPRAG